MLTAGSGVKPWRVLAGETSQRERTETTSRDGYGELQDRRGGAGYESWARGATKLIVSRKSPRRRQTAAVSGTDRHWADDVWFSCPTVPPLHQVFKKKEKEKRYAQVILLIRFPSPTLVRSSTF
mmetsp:Transcript_56822/g.169652  ORF Transcript_56822/g.169652 Transcript_56822/m.169652 type:complete len:124 (+) Transcript_56822:740-1111(+)